MAAIIDHPLLKHAASAGPMSMVAGVARTLCPHRYTVSRPFDLETHARNGSIQLAIEAEESRVLQQQDSMSKVASLDVLRE